MNAQTKETQGEFTPQTAMDALIEGNQRFLAAEGKEHNYLKQISETASGQYPFAAVVSCIDSRIPTEVVFDQGVGDIFNARVAGNVINEDILGSLEFACKLAGTHLILVLGHTSCGAVKGACDKAKLGNLTTLLEKIDPVIEQTETAEGEARDSSNIDFVNRVAEKNVMASIDAILNNSEVLREMHVSGAIQVKGAMYDVANGEVKILD